MNPELGKCAGAPEQHQILPLLVDLDGSLIRTDTLWESLLLAIHRPFHLLGAVGSLFRGKAAFKSALAEIVEVPAELLPYRTDVVDFVRGEFSRGRKTYLLTGANHKIARCVAAHLGCFSGVHASDQSRNLTGKIKADFACTTFGERGFVYIGNEREDLNVWARAAGAITVATPDFVVRKLNQLEVKMERTFSDASPSFMVWLKALRPHQWSKNGLVLAPVVLAHQWGNLMVLERTLLAVVCFSLIASALYIVNDLLDLNVDRAHAEKCQRPFASGRLTIFAGLCLVGLLMVVVAVLLLNLPTSAVVVLTGYAIASLAYSIRLKTLLAVDIVLLAMFYTSRIFMGGTASGIEISVWTLAFSLFIFISLALTKRLIELRRSGDMKAVSLRRRPYAPEDVGVIAALACASAYMSVLVLGLYINSPEVRLLYTHPHILWVIVPLLVYWLTRFLIISNRAGLYHDPVVFVLKDRASWLVFCVAIGAIMFAR